MSQRRRNEVEAASASRNAAESASANVNDFEMATRRAQRAITLAKQSQQAWLPITCGQEVSAHDMEFLQREPEPLRCYSTNEIVAWRDPNNENHNNAMPFIYGIVARDVGPLSGEAIFSVPVIASEDGKVQVSQYLYTCCVSH